MRNEMSPRALTVECLGLRPNREPALTSPIQATIELMPDRKRRVGCIFLENGLCKASRIKNQNNEPLCVQLFPETNTPGRSMIVRSIVIDFTTDEVSTIPNVALDDREKRIITFLAQGKPYKVISTEIGLTEASTREVIRKIYGRFDVETTTAKTETVLKATKLGLLNLDTAVGGFDFGLLHFLTSTEREVLDSALKYNGRQSTNRELALSLSMSEGSIRDHISRILQKLNVSNRTQAIFNYQIAKKLGFTEK